MRALIDKPELETLDYKPECKCADCNLPPEQRPDCQSKQPVSAPQETLGFNSHVIKPGARANKAEDASQDSKEKKCDLCGEKWSPRHFWYCKGKTEQPNLKIIEAIECLISQINDRLGELPTDGMLQGKGQLRGQALEEIDLFQKTTLCDLRKIFKD